MRTYHDRIIATVVEESKARSLGQCEAELERHVTAEWQRTKNDLLVCLGLQTVLPSTPSATISAPGGAGGAAAANVSVGLAPGSAPLSTPTALPPALQHYAAQVEAIVLAGRGGTSVGDVHALPVATKFHDAATSTFADAGGDMAQGEPTVLQVWRALQHVVREASGASLRAGEYADSYLAASLTASPLAGPFGVFWAGGSTAFLESFSEQAMRGVAATSHLAPGLPLGGDSSALLASSAAYMRLRLGGDLDTVTPPGAHHVVLPRVGEVPFWPLLWHLLRMGLRTGGEGPGGELAGGQGSAALDLVALDTGATPASPNTLFLAVQAALLVHWDVQSSPYAEGSVPGSAAVAALSPQHIRAVRRVAECLEHAQGKTVRPSTLEHEDVPEGNDIYAVACLTLLAGQVPDFNLEHDSTVDCVDVEQGPSDFLWVRLWAVGQTALITHLTTDPGYTMTDVATELVLDMGAAYWDPQQQEPYQYARLCLLAGQVEAAVDYIAAHGQAENPGGHLEDAVHLALAAHHYGLLRTVSPLTLRDRQCTVGVTLHAVAVQGNDPAAGRGLFAQREQFFSTGALALDLTTLLTKFRQARLRSEPQRAAQYFSLLGSAGAGGVNSITAREEAKDRAQLLLELLHASPDLGGLVGHMGPDHMPRADGTLNCIAENSAYTCLTPTSLYDILQRAALGAASEGRWQHAFELQLHAGNSASALSILVQRLAALLPETDSSERSQWHAKAHTFQRSALARLADVPGGAAAGDAGHLVGQGMQARLASTAVPLEGFPYSVVLAVLRTLLKVYEAADMAMSSRHGQALAQLQAAGVLPTPEDGTFWNRVSRDFSRGSSPDPLQHVAMRKVLFSVLRLAMQCLVAQYTAHVSGAGLSSGAELTALRRSAQALYSISPQATPPLTPSQVDELRRLGSALLQ